MVRLRESLTKVVLGESLDFQLKSQIVGSRHTHKGQNKRLTIVTSGIKVHRYTIVLGTQEWHRAHWGRLLTGRLGGDGRVPGHSTVP